MYPQIYDLKPIIDADEDKDKVQQPTSFFDEPTLTLKSIIPRDPIQDQEVAIYEEPSSNWDLDSQFFKKKISTAKTIKNSRQKVMKQVSDNPDFKNLLKKRKFIKKNNNTVRFLIDLAIENLPKYLDRYSNDKERQKIVQLCQEERQWHLAQKKNVYNVDHLRMFFSNNDRQLNAEKTRELYSQILRNQSINSMKRPKSQINDKVHYLRVVKIFNLRCRSQALSLRNQYR